MHSSQTGREGYDKNIQKAKREFKQARRLFSKDTTNLNRRQIFLNIKIDMGVKLPGILPDLNRDLFSSFVSIC